MIPADDRPRDFYRIEKGVFGERLIAVAAEAEATYASMAYVQAVRHAHERTSAALRARVDQLVQRGTDLDAQVTMTQQRAEKAENAAVGYDAELHRCRESIRRLVAKNATLISEKRRLRDVLIAKKGLPSIHYRLDIDRDDTARESTVETLDAFPHRDRVREALAEARLKAARQGGRVRQLRLDTVAWRAVIQHVVDDGE